MRRRLGIRHVLCAFLLPGGLFGASAGDPAKYYVAKGGDDSNPGTETRPRLTIGGGIKLMSGGDTLVVKAGIYAEAVINALPGGASWSGVTTLMAHPGDTVVLRPPGGEFVLSFTEPSQKYIEVNGFVVDASTTTLYGARIWEGAHHIRLKNLEIKHARTQGVSVLPFAGSGGRGASDNEFINLDIHHTGKTELDHGMYVGTDRNLVENCRLHDNAGYGIQFYLDPDHKNGNPDDNVIRGSRVYGNGGTGIGMFWGVHSKAYNNVVHGNGAGIQTSQNNSLLANNTVYKNKGWGVRVSRSRGVQVRNNILFENGSAVVSDEAELAQSNNLTGDPGFVSAAKSDFRLLPGSAAIDAGLGLAEVTVDIEGTRRPQGTACDIGAYEFRGRK